MFSNKAEVLDYFMNECPEGAYFTYDDENEGIAYLTDEINNKEYSIEIKEI